MHEETERKFLISHDGWKARWVSRERLRDGLILAEGGRKLRVRIGETRATFCYKGAKSGSTRTEYEYVIPVDDAEALLKTQCDGRIVEKTRYTIPEDGRSWIVDVYGGVMDGTVIAEIELSKDDSGLLLPEWIGEEVTGREAYRKSVMLKAALARSFQHKR